jgi:hypothetical protein
MMFLLLWACSGEEESGAPVAADTPAVLAEPAPLTPAPGSPGPIAPQPYRAADGSIYTDKLFLGVLSLEQSPHPLSPAQAREVLRVIGLLEAKLRKNAYYDERIVALSTPAQVALMDAEGARLTQDVMHARFTPERIRGVVAELERLAEAKAPAEELSVPEKVLPNARPATVSRMTLFMVSFDTMQADPALAIGKEQAAALLPVVDAYVRLKSMKQQTKADILAALSDEQKAWIDTHPPARDDIRDMTVLTAQLKTAMAAKL